MAIDVTITRAYKDSNYFKQVSSYVGAGGGTTPTSSGPHNQLTGLQGGTVGEYYHLTSAEHDKLAALVDQMVLDGSDISQIKIDSIVEFSADAGVNIENINVTNNIISTDSGTGNLTLSPADDVVITTDLAIDNIKKNEANFITFESDIYITGGNIGIGVEPTGDFMIETAGGVGPSIGYTYHLGDTNKRWQSIFVEAINLLSDDSSSSTAAGIFAGAYDILYINSGSGGTVMNTASVDNFLWIENNSVETIDYVQCLGSEIKQVANNVTIWTLTSSGLKLGAGSTVNYIENSLTDNAARLPTSAAVTAAVAANNLWDRTGTTLTTHNAGDAVTIDGAFRVNDTDVLVYDATAKVRVQESSEAAGLIDIYVSTTQAYIAYNYTSDGVAFGINYSGVNQIKITGTYVDLNYSGKRVFTTINASAVGIIGNSTGVGNTAWLGFYESGGSTRQGYVGFASSSDDLYISADVGNVRITAGASGQYVLQCYSSSATGHGTYLETIANSSSYNTLTVYDFTLSGNIFRARSDGQVYMENLGTAAASTILYITSGRVHPPSSDIKLKKNIVDWNYDSLAFLKALPIRKYDRRDSSNLGEIGWIAQEVEKLIPEMVWEDTTGIKIIKEQQMFLHYHNAINQIVDKIDNKFEIQETIIARLEKRVAKLELLII